MIYLHSLEDVHSYERDARAVIGIPFGGLIPQWAYHGEIYTLEEGLAKFGADPPRGLQVLQDLYAAIYCYGKLGIEPRLRKMLVHAFACSLPDDPHDVRTELCRSPAWYKDPFGHGYLLPTCDALAKVDEVAA